MTTRYLAIVAAAVAGSFLAACGPPTFDVGEPFAIVSAQPSADEKKAEVDVLPEIGFNRAVDVSTAGSAVHLVSGENEDDVEFTLSPREENSTLRLIPRRALPFDSDVKLTVDGTIESADGVKLENNFVLSFHTKAVGE